MKSTASGVLTGLAGPRLERRIQCGAGRESSVGDERPVGPPGWASQRTDRPGNRRQKQIGQSSSPPRTKRSRLGSEVVVVRGS